MGELCGSLAELLDSFAELSGSSGELLDSFGELSGSFRELLDSSGELSGSFGELLDSFGELSGSFGVLLDSFGELSGSFELLPIPYMWCSLIPSYTRRFGVTHRAPTLRTYSYSLVGRSPEAMASNPPTSSGSIWAFKPKMLLSHVYAFPGILNIFTSVSLTPAPGTPFLMSAFIDESKPSYIVMI